MVAEVVATAGLAELFGLKKSASVFFAGDADGLAAGEVAVAAVVFFLCSFFAGEADASAAAVAAGDASVLALALRLFFGLAAGEASVPAAGDSLASAEAPFFL